MPRTRENRIDYRMLNDGSDEEVGSEDRITESDNCSEAAFVIESDASIENPDVVSSRSASQVRSQNESNQAAESSATAEGNASQIHQRPAPVTDWLWSYFDTTAVNREWTMTRTKKRKLTDKDIRCKYVSKKTGIKCNWNTTDSARQSSTGNMKLHLAKHGIHPPGKQASIIKADQPTIMSLLSGKRHRSNEETLERNIIRWVVEDKQAFNSIESPSFRRIFQDIPGISLPFGSRHTLRRRIEDEFLQQRVSLKDDLSNSCQTISLSVDVWTSTNGLPIFGMIGHWLTETFELREEVLDFAELHGAHSGENLALAVQTTLEELGLQHKLMAMTGDNASNNETMADALYHSLTNYAEGEDQESSETTPLKFQGSSSYVRCLAHVINLIVKDVLRTLKDGTMDDARAACDALQSSNPIGTQSALGRLRILALWIHRHPQRRQKWKEVCRMLDLPNKYIEYDVETRWNSTFRMIDDGLKAKKQIKKFLELQNELPPFNAEDWVFLQQLHEVLDKFNEHTLWVSQKSPQISLAVPIYYELHDLLDNASAREGTFRSLGDDIPEAVSVGMRKFEKYYRFMDESDTYYAALILDPRVKGKLLKEELQEDDAGQLIIQSLRLSLHRNYPPRSQPPVSDLSQVQASVMSDVESRMLRRLHPSTTVQTSDIDKYFDSPIVGVTTTSKANWICDWWRSHKDEYPQMAAAARDFLAIPASGASVERLFSSGRDLLGVRRHSMKPETMRMLMLMTNAYKD